MAFVRTLLFSCLGLAAFGLLPLPAQDAVVQEFSGNGTTTTGLFKVHDRWEVRWNARQVVSVAVMSSDGTIVAGAAGVLRGSLFVPLGGQYYLKITDGTVPPPPPVPLTMPPATNAPPSAAVTNAATTTTNAPPAPSSTSAPVPSTNSPPEASAPAAADTNAPPVPTDTNFSAPMEPEQLITWHLQIVELAKTIASDQQLSVYTPFFTEPDSAIAPAPPPGPPPVLTKEQAATVVTIKGDNAQGAGFFVRTPDGTFVATHLHLLAANPNVTLTTSTGAPITVLSLKGASDRDLALIAIKDDHYTYLPLFTDAAAKVETGEQVIIPDIGAQVSDVLLGTPGRLIGMAPDQIDFDNPLDAGCAGAPVIHAKSGKVLAIVTPAKHADVTDYIARAWTANPPPGSARIIPFYGLPLYGVAAWEKYDWNSFLAESAFLKQFHQDTRCLDSYLNGRGHGRVGSDGTGPPDNRYFLNNTKIQEANDSYKQNARGGDQNQQLDSASELISDLEGVADTDLNTLQNGSYLYSYDQLWAQRELAYRKALKKELDDLGNNVPRMEDIARTR